VRRHKGFGGTRADLIVNSLRLASEVADLKEYPLFQNVLLRTARVVKAA
jgi:hypothetical protein